MTATVLDSEFILDELKHVPIVEAVWPKHQRWSTFYTSKVKYYRAILKLIDAFLTEQAAGNVYTYF